jgi:predicted ATPase/DNA-binding SARP family transcriptional activator
MEFRMLGPLEVRGERGALALGPIKPRAVLAVLLLHPNEPVTAERLALSLWGEDAPGDATRTVQVYVSRLRKALGDPEAIATTPAGYRLRVRADELDAERFERGVEDGRRALAAGESERAGALLRAALGLWRGPPLAELAFEPFAQAEIARLQEQRLAALEARLDADLAMGRHAALIGELQGLLAAHPTRERLAADLMLALYRSGRQAEALEVYRDARRVLVEQVGVEPGPELQRRHHAVLNQDASLELPTRAGEVIAPLGAEAERGFADEPKAQPGAPDEARRSAVPRPPNRTVGRAREVGAVTERLRAEHVRLLTLTGPGGVGKTRLAVEAARAVEADFADGAGFVALAAVGRAQDVARAIMDALAIVPLAGESPADAVERFLAVKHLLLVIDNCEHLPAAAPFIGRLPAAGPGVTVLATSREPLAVHAERVFLVPPLAMPDPATHRDLDALLGVDAIALFCERARAHNPDFEISHDSAGPVAAICRRLDGLPLAIELAAARCALLSPSEIAARLGVALSALGGGPRDAPARQRTLRATLDWSHGLLDDDEQACFARMAVFAGGATVDAAEAVAGADLDTLDRLVAKSLLVRRRGRHGPTRLGMLETVREYAGERFAALPDREAVRERHFAHYLRVARHHGILSAIDGPDGREHLACLDDELENFRAALGFAAERDAAERVLELSTALIDYWMRRDRCDEAAHWVLPALQKTAATADPALRARALGKAFWPLWDLKRTNELAPLLTEAETLASTVPDFAIRAEVLYNCAGIQGCIGRSDEAKLTADEALRTAQASGDAWTIAMAAWARALTAGSAEELRTRIDEAAPLLAGVGNAYHLHALLCIAVTFAWRRGRDAEAAMYLDRAIPLARRLHQPSRWLHMLDHIGLAALLRGDSAAADDAFREALTLSHDLGFSPHRVLTGLAAVAAVQGRPERAARLAGAVAAHHSATDDVVQLRLEAGFLEPARLRWGPDTWEAFARAGAALSLQEATVYALEQPPIHARRPPSRTPAETGRAD